MEKGTLLREEDFKTLADRDLRFVGFNLTEIRLDRSVQDQAILNDEFGIQSAIDLCRAGIEARQVRITEIEATEGTKQSIGYELHVAPRRNVFHSSYLAVLRDNAFFALCGVWPE